MGNFLQKPTFQYSTIPFFQCCRSGCELSAEGYGPQADQRGSASERLCLGESYLTIAWVR